MTALRVISVAAAAPECAVCEREVPAGMTWCSTPCRNADDQHDAFDYRADDDFEMGDDDA